MKARGERKVKKGLVISNKMKNTLVIQINSLSRHPVYDKVVKRKSKCYAHYEGENTYEEGDSVTIVECRPKSKLKRWRVLT